MKIKTYGDAYHSQNQKGHTGTKNNIPLDVSSNKSSISNYEHDDKLHIPNTKSKKWYNASYFLCKNCTRMSWGKKHFIEHLAAVHKVKTPKKELSSFASRFEEHEYTCKICQKIMKHERPAIGYHLKHAHNMTVPEYEHLHEDENPKTESDNIVENVPDNKHKADKYNAIRALKFFQSRQKKKPNHL